MKKNPDRTASLDTRPISDLRSVNLRFTEDGDLFPAWVPSIVDIVGGIQRRRRRFPKMAAMMRKSDIGGPPDRIAINPDLSKLTITESDGRERNGQSFSVTLWVDL